MNWYNNNLQHLGAEFGRLAKVNLMTGSDNHLTLYSELVDKDSTIQLSTSAANTQRVNFITLQHLELYRLDSNV